MAPIVRYKIGVGHSDLNPRKEVIQLKSKMCSWLVVIHIALFIVQAVIEAHCEDDVQLDSADDSESPPKQS